MRQIVRYRFLTIPSKLQGEVRLTINDVKNAIYTSTYEGGRSTNIALFPVVALSISHKGERDDSGSHVRASWNPNDNVTMTKYTFPIFIHELKTFYEKLKTPNLYTYTGNRLELNEKEAENIRSVFTIGFSVVELSPVIIEEASTADDATRQLEGIKLKFNNEQSSTTLTINEVIALIYNLTNLDLDSVTLQMFSRYVDISDRPVREARRPRPATVVDITPKSIYKNDDLY